MGLFSSIVSGLSGFRRTMVGLGAGTAVAIFGGKPSAGAEIMDYSMPAASTAPGEPMAPAAGGIDLSPVTSALGELGDMVVLTIVAVAVLALLMLLKR